MMGYYGWHPAARNIGFANSGFGILSMAFFVLLVVVFIFMLLKHTNIKNSDEGEDQALNILKVRYAKGEIDKKKFEEMKKEIR